MQDIKQNKQIYLSGGGNDQQSFPLDKFFFDTLPKNGRFLYVPVALREYKLFSMANLWMKNLVALHNRTDIQFDTLDSVSNKRFENIKSFDAIYIGGGNTWSLMKEIKESGFGEILIQYMKSVGRIYGGSAGAIILGKRIDTNNDKNKVSWTNDAGLNLLNNYSIVCHFKYNEENRIKTWAQRNNLPIICLTEETGLIVENGTAKCVGPKPCVIYESRGERLVINIGDTISLK